MCVCVLVSTIADQRRKKSNMKRNWKRQTKRLYFVIKQECVVCEMQKKKYEKVGTCKPKLIVLDWGREFVVISLYFFSFQKGDLHFYAELILLIIEPHNSWNGHHFIHLCWKNYYVSAVLLCWHSNGDGEWEYAWTSIIAFNYYDDGDEDNDDDVDLFQQLACRHKIQHRNSSESLCATECESLSAMWANIRSLY